jgi:emp24/gp25L/p24 family/GOLD
VTTSIIVLGGNELKATTEFEGPIPSETPITSGTGLYEAIKRMEAGMFGTQHHAVMREVNTVDFEHLNMGTPPNDDGADGEEEIPENESIEQRRERRARQRKKALEARQRRDAHKVEQKAAIRMEGEPIEMTRQAKGAGWYRYCIKSSSSWGQITVEVDFRKGSEMGGLNVRTGHVLSTYDRAAREEEEYLMQDTADTEGIKDEDFENTREKLKTLRRLIADIQSKQAQERHRLVVHSTTNQHSHSRMVLSSLLETILFMAVTGYQVYTIRKWFRGAPVLGR